MRFLLKLCIGVLALTSMMTFGVAQGTGEPKDKIKVGFVYVGPIGEYGWTFQHNEGRLAIEEALGDKVETSYIESVPEGPDAERVIQQLASSGHDLIFTTSFNYMNPTLKVAKKFPQVAFEHATGFKRSKNVSTYSARFYEGRYIQGVIAGKTTKSNVIGYIGSFPIPEVVRGINAYTLGALSVNPDVKIKVIWANSWYNPGKEGDAAKALIDQGVDVLTQHTDSPAPLKVAQERGIKGFGQASDMIGFAEDSQLSAVIDDWRPYYVERAKAVLNGTWASQDVWGGISSGMVSIAPFTNMPDDLKALAEDIKEKITNGDLKVFSGPLVNHKGEVKVQEGEVLDDKALLGMDWYVQGVEGKIDQ